MNLYWVNLYYTYAYLQNKIQPGLPKPRLFTVGRLDVATSGLIIVTNDGKFIILGNMYSLCSNCKSLAFLGTKLLLRT